jgi:hypothetical protein
MFNSTKNTISVIGYNWKTNKKETRDIIANSLQEVDQVAKETDNSEGGKFEPLRLDTLIKHLGEWANVHELTLMNSQYVYFAPFSEVLVQVKTFLRNGRLEFHDRKYQK